MLKSLAVLIILFWSKIRNKATWGAFNVQGKLGIYICLYCPFVGLHVHDYENTIKLLTNVILLVRKVEDREGWKQSLSRRVNLLSLPGGYVFIRICMCVCLYAFACQYKILKIKRIITKICGTNYGHLKPKDKSNNFSEIWIKIGWEISKCLFCFAGQSKQNATLLKVLH